MDRYEFLAVFIVAVAVVPIGAVLGFIAFEAFRTRRKKHSTQQLNVPVFGLLERDGGLWVSMPSDTGNDFMVIVDANESGPSTRQQRFFEDVIANAARYEDQAKSFVGSQNSEVDPSCLRLYAVEISSDEELRNGEFVLELSEDGDEIHRCEFKELVPSQYGMDH